MKNFLCAIATTILIIILFISTTFTLLLLPVKHTFKGKTFKTIISNLEIEKIIKTNDELKKAVDEVLDPIFVQTHKLGIDDEVIIQIMDNKEVKNVIGNITENIMDYAITGENKKIISNENITEAINSAIININESGYYKINEQEKTNLLNIVNNKITEYQDIIPNTNAIDDKINPEHKEFIENIRFILGNKLLAYLIITLIISILLILLLKWKQLKWIKYSAVTILISSIITNIITALISLPVICKVNQNYDYILDIINKFVKYSYIVSISTLISMIIILIIYKILKNKALEQ